MTEAIEQLKELSEKPVSLTDVHNVYKKWLKFKSTDRIDVVLATAKSRTMKGTKLWLIIIAPSGDAKTEQILSISDDITTKIVRKFTPRTLVSGSKNGLEDLAPKLKDKIMLIPDFSQLLQLHPNDKALVWAQLRDLFDGYAGVQSGLGADKEYKDLNVTFIAGSTPAIDSQILIYQSLGTRELIWRVEDKDLMETEEVKDKVWDNEEHEEEMRHELNLITTEFLKNCSIKNIKIPPEIKSALMVLVDYLTIMRASATIDSFSGELISDVTPEAPTRALKQLKRYYICLKSLDEDYSDEKALRIITHIVESSIVERRVKVLENVIKSNPYITTSGVSQALKIGKRTAYAELNILWNLGLVDKDEEINEYDRVVKQSWKPVKSNMIVKFLMRKLGIDIEKKEGDLSEFT